jgi:hypothetical protein
MVRLTVDGKSQPECRLAQQGIREKEIPKNKGAKKKGAQRSREPNKERREVRIYEIAEKSQQQQLESNMTTHTLDRNILQQIPKSEGSVGSIGLP